MGGQVSADEYKSSKKPAQKPEQKKVNAIVAFFRKIFGGRK